MSEKFIINDGYTRTSRINRIPGIHPEINFEFRPMGLVLRDELRMQVARLSPEKFHPILARALAKHILSWDMTDKGQPLKIDEAAIIKLQPSIHDRLYAIVTGRDSGDLEHAGEGEDMSAEMRALVAQDLVAQQGNLQGG